MARTEFERKFKLLKAEVDLDFPGLVGALESGLKVVVVTEPYPTFKFDPDHIRRMGGMAVLCWHYGAAAIFVNASDFVELNGKQVKKS